MAQSSFDAEISRTLHTSLTEFYRHHLSIAIASLRESRIHTPAGSVRNDESHLLTALEFLSQSKISDRDIKDAIQELDAIGDSAFSMNALLRTEFLFWKAESERISSNSSSAQEHYSFAIASSPNDAISSLIRFRKAELFEKKGQMAEALAYYDSVAQSTATSELALQASLRRASLLGVMGRSSLAITELDRARSILARSSHIYIADRRLEYGSLTEAFLRGTKQNDTRIISRYSEGNIEHDSLIIVPQIVSPYTEGTIALLEGSQLTELGKYDEAIKVFTDAERKVAATVDSTKRYANERSYLVDAIRFEKAWAQLISESFSEAATGFLALASSDSLRLRSNGMTYGTLRDAGRYGDHFFEESSAYAPRRDTSAPERLDYSTAPVYYSDYPTRARYYAGIALSRMGKADEARKILTTLAQDESAIYSDKARYHLALVEARSERLFQAEALLAPLGMHRTPSGVYASLLLGDMHYRRNSFARAAEYFRFVLENLTEKDTALRLMAQLERGLSLIPLGSWAEASNQLEQYIRNAPKNVRGREEALFWLGRAYLRVDSAAQARDCFRQILDEYPKSDRQIDAQYGYAWTLFRNGEYTNADIAFKKVLEMDSITRYAYDALSRRGDAMYAAGEIKKALKIYNLAVDRPTFNKYLTTRAMFQLGLARMRSDSSRSAMNAFNYIITKYPQSDLLDRAYLNFAISAFAILQTDKAEEAIRTLSTKYPESAYVPKALYLAASEAENSDDDAKALLSYKKIVKSYSSSSEFEPALFNAIEILARNKKYIEAIALCDSQLIRRNTSPLPFQPKLLLRKGELQLAANKPKDATVTFDLFADKYPKDPLRPQSMYLLGKALISSGNTESGMAKYNDVITQYPYSDASSFVYVELARIEKAANHLAKTAEYYTQAFSLDRYSSDAAPGAMLMYGGFVKTTLDNPDSALKIYDELTRRYLIETSVGAEAQQRAADILLESGKQTEAIAKLDKIAMAHKGSGRASETHIEIATIYRRSGSVKKALGEYDAARAQSERTEDQYGRSMMGSAEMLIASGDKAKAKVLLRSAASNRTLIRTYREKALSLIEQLSPKKKKKGKQR